MSSLQLPPPFDAPDPALLGHPLWQSSLTYMPSHKPFPWPTFTSKYQVTSVSLCSTSSWKMELGLLSLLLIMCFPPNTQLEFYLQHSLWPSPRTSFIPNPLMISLLFYLTSVLILLNTTDHPLFEMSNFSKFSVTPSFLDFSLMLEAVSYLLSPIYWLLFFCFT